MLNYAHNVECAGDKKCQHTDSIAVKRQQRALLRGFDLAAVNEVRF